MKVLYDLPMTDLFRNFESSYISNNVVYDSASETTAKDGRMFNNCKLYCEGAHKPEYRGFFHVLAAFMFPYIFWKYWELTKDADPATFYLTIFCVGIGFITVVISALFHTVEWTVPQEIMINKVDHLALIVFTMSIFLPSLLLLLPKWLGYTFCAIIVGLTVWNLYGTLHEPPSLFRMMSVPFSQVPTFYHYYKLMTNFEWYSFWTCGISQIAGVIVFVKEFTPFDPDQIGFHEIYHVSTIVSIVAAYLLNYSIIGRSIKEEFVDIS
jgi:predicted membrane channel-forming protein YqfA (hemolysin III family)